jgi:benzoyl-CoA-dihydrodiol lyase
VAPKSKFEDLIKEHLTRLVATAPVRKGPGVALPPLMVEQGADTIDYTSVKVAIDRKGRTATIVVRGPEEEPPADAAALREAGAGVWHLRMVRELDNALCRLRFNEPEIGLLILKTEGDPDRVARHEAALGSMAAGDWFAREIVLMMARTLRRLDVTARSMFALVEPGSCFVGSLLEIALAADRVYALDDPEKPVTMLMTGLNFGALPMGHGLNRLQLRRLHDLESLAPLQKKVEAGDAPRLDAAAALEAGLLTVAADDIDFEDEVRVAIEERASMSPDALTGMEASLRFPGAESSETKIFGRLSAWQNWIFQRPNAVGDQGALKCYGKPVRPAFDWRRT